MNPLMARYAERYQIALLMCAAISERFDMMDERCANVSPPLFAHVTERMPGQMMVTNPAPHVAIPLVLIVATSEVVIMPLHRFLVRLTVATLSIREVRTARHTAGALRLSWHCTSPSKKPSRRIASPRRLIPYPILAESIISLSR